MAGCGCSGVVSKAVSLAGTSPQAANAAVILSAREAAGKRNAAARGKAFASGLNAKAEELKRLAAVAMKAGKISQAKKLAAESAKLAAKAKAAGFVAFQTEKSAEELERISHAVATALTYAMRGDSERSRQAFRVVGSLSGLGGDYTPPELVGNDEPQSPGLTDSLKSGAKDAAISAGKDAIKGGLVEIFSGIYEWGKCLANTKLICDPTERLNWIIATYTTVHGIPPSPDFVRMAMKNSHKDSLMGSIRGSPPTEAEKRAILGPSAAEIEASRQQQIAQQRQAQQQAEARRQQQIRDAAQADQIFQQKRKAKGLSIPVLFGIGAGVLAIGGIAFVATRR